VVLAADDRSLRVKAVIKAGRFDVVRLSFLLRCLRLQRRLEPAFHDYIAMTDATRERLKGVLDRFGDPLTEHVGKADLRRCLRSMPERPRLRWREAARLYLRDEQELGLLRSTG
jgi:hypothetical protein